MIPLGVLASAYVAPAGGGVSVVQHKSASTNTVTLDAAPTAGNRLIVFGCSTASDSATPSHTATTRNAFHSLSGFYTSMHSGVVQSGASATVAFTPSMVVMGVWEVSPCEFEVATTATGSWVQTFGPPAATVDSGALGLVGIMTGATATPSMAGGTLDSVANSGGLFGHTDTPEIAVTGSWTGWTEAKRAILGVYR